MADFDYATAAPLLTAVTDAWTAYMKVSEQQGTALTRSACAPNIDFNTINGTLDTCDTALAALVAYFESIAPQ